MIENTAQASASEAQGFELDLPFHTLGWYQFEQLALTVISDVLGQTVEIFSYGKDGGQDGFFCGNWSSHQNETLEGPTIVQVKFFRQPNSAMTPSRLRLEVESLAQHLESAGYQNYVLITNGKLTGRSAKSIRAMLREAGFFGSLLLGKEWLTEQVRTSARLRNLIPRIYGLGDLSQILDERSYLQTQAVLKAMSFRMDTFVVTKPYRAAVDALNAHNLALLIGDPMTGKTTISFALALSSSDAASSRVLITHSAEEFRAHWNPNEPRQLFWVDDIFGQTSYDAQRTREWSRQLPLIQAAIKSGARFIFTSRSYIWKSAQLDLKRADLPLFDEASVRIVVEELSQDERRAILYNHVRLGDQSTNFKQELRPHLDRLVPIDPFYPEVARRLGRQFFTKTLPVTEASLIHFFVAPLAYLIDVIKELDASSRALLALMFARGGSLPLPFHLIDVDKASIEALGTTTRELWAAISSLEGNLLISSTDLKGTSQLTFAHPTVRDALASITAEDPKLVELYLAGVSIETLMDEASFVGNTQQGVKVYIPEQWFDEVARRLLAYRREPHPSDDYADDSVLEFLRQRASADFLRRSLTRYPNLFDENRTNWLNSTDDPWFDLIGRLIKISRDWHEIDRAQVQALRLKAKQRIIDNLTSDVSTLLVDRGEPILSSAEFEDCLYNLRDIVLNGELYWAAKALTEGFARNEDPDSQFAAGRRYIKDVRGLIDGVFLDEKEIMIRIDVADSQLEERYDQVAAAYVGKQHSVDQSFGAGASIGSSAPSSKDIFRDVADPN